MKKVVIILMLLTLPGGSPILATKWAELNPEEVESRSQVIVLGTYNFKSKPNQNQARVIFMEASFMLKRFIKEKRQKTSRQALKYSMMDGLRNFSRMAESFCYFWKKQRKHAFLFPLLAPMEWFKCRMTELYQGMRTITEK